MNTRIDNRKVQGSIFAVFLLTLAAGAPALADASVDDSRRLSVSTEMTRQQRDAGAAGMRSEREYSALQTGTTSSGKLRTATQSKSAPAASYSANFDFWFYDADVELFGDADGDGYFRGIDLLFDADTYYNYAEVYAVAYLSLEGGPWNEYAVTETFSISGTAADDEYVIVTELVSGYPRGSYDLLVELFDADTDAFLAAFGPEDTPELAFLPLEDTGRDTPAGSTTIIVDERGGGGSLDWLLLLLLLPVALRNAWRHWPAPSAGSA